MAKKRKHTEPDRLPYMRGQLLFKPAAIAALSDGKYSPGKVLYAWRNSHPNLISDADRLEIIELTDRLCDIIEGKL